jgi:hypothetical protein
MHPDECLTGRQLLSCGALQTYVLVVWGCDLGLLGLAYLGLLILLFLFPPCAARFTPPACDQPSPEGFQALLSEAVRGYLTPSSTRPGLPRL